MARVAKAKATPRVRQVEQEMIDPDEWGALGVYIHEGISYGRGEPVPEMSLEDAKRYEASGSLTRRGQSGDLKPSLGVAPKTAMSYLQGKDHIVLRNIRQHHPTVMQLVEIADLARNTGRSEVLQEALSLAAELASE